MRSSFSPAFSTSAVRTSKSAVGKWNIELFLRYVAATVATWVALAGAQLIVPTNFVLILGALTLIGTPISIFLRLSDMCIGKFEIPRAFWNGLTVIASGFVGIFFLLPTIGDMWLMWSHEPQSFWLRFGGGDSLGLLMQAFLVFAAMRSFALVTDKDTTYTTIPSFSVLLLLIPVHKGLEVVCYFLVWTVVATVLFALDHHSELSAGVVARIPAPEPGQDVRLAARSLLTILGISLTAAIAISVYITSRNLEDRSEAETAITSLAARITQFALSLPDGSVNSGPERQIDFSSGPNIPSRAELWRAQAITMERRVLRPDYWRLFSLSIYNGSSWAQASGRQRSIKKSTIDWIRGEGLYLAPGDTSYINARTNWALDSSQRRDFAGRADLRRDDRGRDNRDQDNRGNTGNSVDAANGVRFPPLDPSQEQLGRPDENLKGDRRDFGSRLPEPPRGNFNGSDQRPENRPLPPDQIQTPDQIQNDLFRGNRVQQEQAATASPMGVFMFGGRPMMPLPGYPGLFTRKESGFNIGSVSPATHEYGAPTQLTRVNMRAQTANLGYIPSLPGVQTLFLRQREQNEVRVSFDGAADLGVMQPGERAGFTGQIPRLVEYGFRGGTPPQKFVAAKKGTPVLEASERKLNLQLPETVTKRTREFGALVVKNAPKDESNYARAQRLARAIQEDAVYTLRPPAVPDGRDATDFFLFEGAKRGYCTYFAGALTVLCRTQGIPARVVSGFASPEYLDNGEAILRDANAHAWTEVWVDNWGWAVVDATPEDDRGDNAPNWIESWVDWLGSVLDASSRAIRAQLPLITALFTGLTVMFIRWRRIKLGYRRRNQSKHPEVHRREIALQYERMSHMLARRFRPRASWETPDEWLAAAEAALPNLPIEQLRLMTELYLQSQFSPRPVNPGALTQAREAVQGVRQFRWRQKPA